MSNSIGPLGGLNELIVVKCLDYFLEYSNYPVTTGHHHYFRTTGEAEHFLLTLLAQSLSFSEVPCNEVGPIFNGWKQ